MPSRIKTRALKALKENGNSESKSKNTKSNVKAVKSSKENINSDNKLKTIKSNTKVPRKALADKTNSASDDTSIEVPTKPKKTVSKSSNVGENQKSENKQDERPRRNRRLPTRFTKNPVLVSLSNSKDNVIASPPDNAISNISKKENPTVIQHTPIKSKEPEVSPFKTPSKAETSLVVSRPRRICRLPSRFDDHLISPNKYIQPGNASTPKQQTKVIPSPAPDNTSKEINSVENNQKQNAQITKISKTNTVQEKTNASSSNKSSPDTNNNAKGRSTRAKRGKPQPQAPKKSSPNVNSIKKFFNRIASPQLTPPKKVSPKPTNSKRLINKNLSFKVLGGNKESQEKNKDLDIYEFTFDPKEEPQPSKKKRKKPAVKNPTKVTKPKVAVKYKSTYDQNISKALSALKKAVQPSKAVEPAKLPQIQEMCDEIAETLEPNHAGANNMGAVSRENNIATMNDTGKTSVHECNYPSIRVEDIAADIEPSMDHHDDLNYSPVNSPRPVSPANPKNLKQTPKRASTNDPLNLQEELSFFDDIPVASSSMNASVRHPMASPWRVEFGSLPIKWHSNTYVKPNMTPAVESSFICSEDSTKKKHVYTNLVPETNDSLPEIVTNTSNLKQTSIISFIKEVAERKARKKARVSQRKEAAVFDNISSEGNKTPGQPNNKATNEIPSKNTSEEVSSNDTSNENENSKEARKTRKRKNDENICGRPAKSPRKGNDKDCTYFGFDDSENLDQENVSPSKSKVNARGRSLRPRSRAVLQEINGPTRAALPVAAKSKVTTSSEAVNRVYEELKSGADAPVFPEKNVPDNITNIDDLEEDSESVHLFEDLELVHHLKPTRKSYGKAKKVTFRQQSTSGSDIEDVARNNANSSFEDDLGDLTFEVPNVKEKKKTKKRPKKLMSKKEEKEAEEWAAGFNSMCEEIEDFPLVVE